MSVLHYLDNEVPAFGEWDSVVTTGLSTIVQTADAAFPERGAVGLRAIRANSSGAAYCIKNFDPCAIHYGLQIKVYPGWVVTSGDYGRMWFGSCYDAGDGIIYEHAELRLYSDGTAKLLCYPSSSSYSVDITDRLGDWIWYVRTVGGGLRRGWVDGVKFIDTSGAGTLPARLNIGVWSSSNLSSAQIDIDEIKIATSAVGTGYPEPFVPEPLTEYPEARRTVVLFRQGSTDSTDFADYCVEKLDVPRCNLCPLPNATANETLADYATFQTEVETDLAAWLALNPTVAANCSCFLIGHGVPGYFMVAGSRYSVSSRLMNYGNAFTPGGVTNPLYNPTVVERFTVSGLRATGSYLCSRIDADTLQHSKDILDCGLQIADCGFLPATDKLYSDDATYLASLACGHLRIQSTDYTDYTDLANDAFVFGHAAGITFGTAGTRAVFCDDSADSADALRATSELFDALVTNGYAAGLGFSATPSALLPTPFFEMLRLGGTLAEAFAVAVAKLDYTAVAVGSPVMTMAFSTTGCNVYRGLGGIEGIDWDNPVAYLRAGQDSVTFNQDLSPGRSYVYAVRAVSSAGVEEHNTHIITYVESDEQGDLLPAPLACPADLTADVQQSSLLIGFSYYAPVGFAGADGFDVLGDNGTGQLDLDNPVATVERSRHDRFDFEVSITRPDTSVLLAVRPRQGQHTGPISEILSVPLISAPAPAQIL